MDRVRLADTLRRALAGRLTIEEATALFLLDGIRGDAAAEAIAHAIVHFVTDADLRARDAGYDTLLRRGLEQHLKAMVG